MSKPQAESQAEPQTDIRKLDVLEMLKAGPLLLAEYRSESREFREWVDQKTGKARSMAILTWRCETLTGQQVQIGTIANSIEELPPTPYVKGQIVLAVCSKITEERDVLNVRAESHRPVVL